jgi:hypothetical protein
MMQYPTHVIRIQGSLISETTTHFLQVWKSNYEKREKCK